MHKRERGVLLIEKKKKGYLKTRRRGAVHCSMGNVRTDVRIAGERKTWAL